MSERGEVVCWVHPYALAAGALGIECSPVQFGKDQFALVRQSDYLALREELDELRGQLEHSEEGWHMARREMHRALNHRDAAEAELAALKARIAEAPARTGIQDGAGFEYVGCTGLGMLGKRVRLLLEEP